MRQRLHRAEARQSASVFGLKTFIFDDIMEAKKWAGFFLALLYRSAIVPLERAPLFDVLSDPIFHTGQRPQFRVRSDALSVRAAGSPAPTGRSPMPHLQACNA
ncbi:hypothetical protein [Pararhizobium sp. A13]|uniref:hypothetical protein n=1 Tax=Pararhizobium sp. A13 TaxID=3133975 RepID=UPI00324C0B26